MSGYPGDADVTTRVDAYQMAPGARVMFRGDGTVDLRPPAQGFPMRAVHATRAVLPLVERLDEPTRLDALIEDLTPGYRGGDLIAQINELARFGVIRAVRERVPRPGSARAGFLVFALGRTRYARLASNAATTLRARVPDCEIALVHDGASLEGLPEERLALFDQLIECPPAYRSLDGRFAPLLAKLHVDRLSPFDHTVALDADVVFLPDADVESELGRYVDCDFAPMSTFTHLRGRTSPADGVILWASADECLERFGVPERMIQCHTYYHGFTRSAATSALFAKAREIYHSLSERPLPSMQMWYGAEVPDELALSVATGLVDVSIYDRIHVPVMNNQMTLFDGAWDHYLGFTFCGAPPDAAWQRAYDRVVTSAAPPGMAPLRWADVGE